MTLGRIREFEVEALSVYRVLDKLSRAGVEVLSFRLLTKSSAVFTVNGKDCKKVFAILQGSCYNIKKVRPRGLSSGLNALVRSAGIVVGIVVFFFCVLFFETRVLDIRIQGSGAYYRDDVIRILSENGVKKFKGFPKDCKPITAEIFSLPRVSFCTVGKAGGIVTVTVEVTDEEEKKSTAPLLSPAAGTVEELVVVRGTPLVKAGDTIAEGDIVVSNEAVFGEETVQVIVIARVVVAVPFSKVYGGSEENARLTAMMEFGTVKEIHITKNGDGWLAEGVALIERAVNLP